MQDETMDAAAPLTGQALRYKVAGMDCPSCVGKIETALRRLPGASGVGLNHHSQILRLTLDEAATPRATVEATIRGLGFGVEPADTLHIAEGGAAFGTAIGTEPRWWQTGRGRIAILIGLLVGGGFLLSWLAPGVADYALMPAALFGLAVFGRRAVRLARSGSPFSIEMLMSVATLGALVIGEAEEAAVVVLLFAIGELLEGVAAGTARSGIRALSALVPRTALLIEGESARAVPVEQLEVGQLVLVRPGDRVSADGVVEEGESDIDESPVTGESVPVAKSVGSPVFAGGINATGVLRVRVTRKASDNTIARIVQLVEEAQAAKSPTARWIERFSARYTPAVIAVSVLTVLVPPLGFGGDWHSWIYRGLALLLIGCPCALVLSTPAAIASGIAAGARRGLLIKGGAALEAIGKVRTIAFDKTGTLTLGQPRVTDIVPLDGTERTLLGLAATVENGSAHPLARAILERAAADGVPLRPARDRKAVPGRAVQAVVGGRLIEVGSPRHAVERSGAGALPADTVAGFEEEGKTVAVVLADGRPIGLLALRDEPRPDAARGIAALRGLGVRSVMLTGDNRRTGQAVARTLGLEVEAELLPEDKLRAIAGLKGQGTVAMIGDGINDGPALAAADVGISMGGGTDVALETADAALLGNRVEGVAELVALSRATLANIRQNVAFALGLKAVFLVTTLFGITDLWLAILADTGATIIVTLNALRLLRREGGSLPASQPAA
ncbi:heavy metal translocating P-type ATPase [Azospirillum formosense]|uniref:heavy metal translocating P-type ATPase n=1 Tax=Azospirillum formosense TaxID=861533 RepID=UPI001C90ECBE|nr:heavy metal translocating P-type ATPase [Azospirillum formosense]MBY3757259.1 cadmium-translocating P-type ATPase [Azospirillum formosense]